MTKTFVLMLLLASCSPSLAQGQWTAFSDSKGRFKVLLPGKPIQTAETPPTFNVSTPGDLRHLLHGRP